MKTSSFLYPSTLIRAFLFFFFFLVETVLAQAQPAGPGNAPMPQEKTMSVDPNLTRYVLAPKPGEENNDNNKSHDGLSWANAKHNLQEAINDLRDYMITAGYSEGGRIFVGPGKFVPYETTESKGVQYAAFKIYEGMTIYGGFSGKGTEKEPEERLRKKLSLGIHVHGWDFQNKTVLSGDHSEALSCAYTWDNIKQQFKVKSYGSSYHVVWFATNGFDASGVHAKPLREKTGVDGCIIEGGDSNFKELGRYSHTAYGGGVYMVDNSFLRNCEIRYNNAARRGGAIYMDGGGEVDSCYIHSNQSLGVGGFQGYGGGVSIDQKGIVSHSVIVNNVARVGGGVSLNYEGPLSVMNGDIEELNPVALQPAAVSCLIANNTTSMEAGGIFFNGGGSANQLTVVNNSCNGQDITIGGIRYGRSGGGYILDCARIFNSVFWGNKVEANRDIQMAIIKNNKIDRAVRIAYSAFANHDISDWTGSEKMNVMDISVENKPASSIYARSSYPAFVHPCDCRGVWVNEDGSLFDYFSKPFAMGSESPTPVDWQPASVSALRSKSVQVIDLHNVYDRDNCKHLHVEHDLHKVKMEANDALGCLVAKNSDIVPYFPGAGDPNEGIITLFVDPSYKTMVADEVGNSWDAPLNNLNEALNFLEVYLSIEGNVGKKGRVLVKEGTLTTAGQYYNEHMRSSYIKMVSNVTVEGGYPSELTGTNVSQKIGNESYRRNPLEHVTRITGNLADDAYDYNSCHLITFANVSHAVLDGFYLNFANSLSKALFENKPQFQDGGGIICWNTVLGVDNQYTAQNMPGNVVRNCMIGNNSAIRGSAVFVHAEAGTKVDLTLENCVVHNNEAAALAGGPETVADPFAKSTIYVGSGLTTDAHGNQKDATADGVATLHLNHCDIVKNVGHPILTEGKNATVEMDNSVVWGNADIPISVSDSLATEKYRSHHVKFDPQGVHLGAESSNNLFDMGTFPLFDGQPQYPTLLVKSTGTLMNLDFINPTLNIGLTQNADVTKFGGLPDYTPGNLSPLVNAAGDLPGNPGTDLAGNIRNYGGLADVGALECLLLPQYGEVYYVKTAETGGDDNKNDGLSWAKPFATLSKALKDAQPGKKIWIAQGEYLQTPSQYQASAQVRDDNEYLVYQEKNAPDKKVYQNPDDDLFYVIGQTEGYVPFIGEVSGYKPEIYEEQAVENGFKVYEDQSNNLVFEKGGAYYWKSGSHYVPYQAVPQKLELEKEMGLVELPVMETIKVGKSTIECSVYIRDGVKYYKNKKKWYTFKDGSYVQVDEPINPPAIPQTLIETREVNVMNSGYYTYHDQNDNTRKYYSKVANKPPYLIECEFQFYACKTPPKSGELTPKKAQKEVDGYIVLTKNSNETIYQSKVDQFYYKKGKVDGYVKYTGVTDQLVPVYTTDTTSTTFSAFTMKEGVDVLGGFPAKGNPAERDRDPKIYETILQAGDVNFTAKEDADFKKMDFIESIGRVLTQPTDFTMETIWDGLSFTNGFLHAVYRQNLHGKINSIRTNITLAAEKGAAGVYLRRGGVLENCEIKDNLIYVYPKGGSGLDVDPNAGGGCHAVAGGVYNNGGTLKNCVVKNNKIVHRFAGISSWMYGCGLFQSSGTVYNTIIANNVGKVVSDYPGAPSNNFSVAGAGAFLIKGDFYNNTIVGNQSFTIRNAANNTHIVIPGIYVFDGITMYNCIVNNNTNNLQKDWISLKQSKTEIMYGFPVLATIDPEVDGGESTGKNPIPNPDDVRAFNCCVPSEHDKDENQTVLEKRNLIKVDAPDVAEKIYFNLHEDPKLVTEVVVEGDKLYHLKSESKCRNAGTVEIEGIVIPPYDAEYTARVKDCQIDMGAYEYDGSYDISPTLSGEGNTQATFFVTQNGKGVNSGNKENPACAAKIQKILDAAGKYKNDHPTKKVEVHLGGIEGSGVIYTPVISCIRDKNNPEYNDPRRFSLMIPKGITVKGGYKEDFSVRDVTTYKSVFSGIYQDILSGIDVSVYHVVTFVDKLAEGDQDISAKVKERAVLDGVFLANGEATGEKETDKLGGAAIVPDFAQVQNCILQNNEASEKGGALYLKPKALVSGCLFTENFAKRGGAVFVEQVDDKDESSATRARIFTSTFVNNEAIVSGGALSFYNNARVNSSVFWKNKASTQANVEGRYENTQNQKYVVEAFPFAYSAVENVRMPGINNQSVATDGDRGVRFEKASKDAYYMPSKISVLTRTGMPIRDYRKLALNGYVSVRDFEHTARYENDGEQPETIEQLDENLYIEIGARSLGLRTVAVPVSGQVMRRLFVTSPEFVNIEVASQIAALKVPGDLTPELKKEMEINKQRGASFAYPMQSLEEALHYIHEVRKNKGDLTKEDKAFFEIFVSSGTFYPESRPKKSSEVDLDLQNQNNPEYSRSYTFLIPEGVALFGGMDPNVNLKFMCQETEGIKNESLKQWFRPITTNAALEEREWHDMNDNNVYEPWEMKHQTILSGKNVNNEHVNEVYHVISVLADPDLVGFMGPDSNADPDAPDPAPGKEPQQIKPAVVRIDGVQIVNGKAWHDVIDHNKDNIMDYAGGGIFANGIYDEVYKGTNSETGEPDITCKYRSIPLKLTHCRFVNNKAGWGGAVFTTLPTEISSCSFEQNLAASKVGAIHKDEVVENGVTSPAWSMDVKGLGGAIYGGRQLLITNSLFANNEARVEEMTLVPPSGEQSANFKNIYGAGTIALFHMDGRMSMMNCNLVNNKATKYPAIFVQHPNQKSDKTNHTNVMNTIFWGNEATEAKGEFQHYQHVINYDNKDLDQATEALWFCAYEKGMGKKPVRTKDFRGEPVNFTDFLPNKFPKGENSNVILSSINTNFDGPKFTNPSVGAGVDNFLQRANWLPYSRTKLTDNGWTKLNQKITANAGVYDCEFADEKGNPVTETNKIYGAGPYYTYYKVHMNNSAESVSTKYGNVGVPIGRETYMISKGIDGKEHAMYRISLDPNPSHDQTYIDIGLYEYQHVQLDPNYVDGADELWVGEVEDPSQGVANGKTWYTATGDLQRAIETLLCTRNGRPKKIYLKQGEYTPDYYFKDAEENIEKIEFRINTGDLNNSVILPDGTEYKGVESLSFFGGYSETEPDTRDIELFPTKIMAMTSSTLSSESMKYLVEIEDAQQYDNGGSSDGTVIPISFDGITFSNQVRSAADDPVSTVGGSGLYYHDQMIGNELCAPPVLGKNELHPKPKLTVTNCKFVNNGLKDPMATVVVGKGGGRSLFFNDLFHDNLGPSMISTDVTNVVNCTFAQNGGNLQLENAQSKIYGSVFWMNKGVKEFDIAEGVKVSNTAYTDASAELGLQAKDENWVLCDVNEDIFNGPNFVDPANNDVMLRDYNLKPSAALLNGSTETAWAGIDSHLPLSENIANVHDLAGEPRKFGGKVDLGAYEYQSANQRVVYVDAGLDMNAGIGDSWSNAYSGKHLQDAIDLVTLYVATNNKGNGPFKRGYVFVKSPYAKKSTGIAMTLRNGVSIYGGIPYNYKDMVDISDAATEEANLIAFENKIKRDRPGVASPNAGRTEVTGVTTYGNFSDLSVVDGFEVAPLEDDVYEEPAVNLSVPGNGNPYALMMRNCIVHDFNNVTEQPVVRVGNGLLYNVLIRDNKVKEGSLPVVEMGSHGWAVNTTITMHSTTATLEPSQVVGGNLGHVLHSIVGSDELPTFAPYFKAPLSPVDNRDLSHQLVETSNNIDKVAAVDNGLPEELRILVNYDQDRDLLGNPRKIGGVVDNGCYETWTTRKGRLTLSTKLYDGHFYPHEGSVVYLDKPMEVSTTDFDASKANYIHPGFFLLQENGGWYGHGITNLALSYVAVERHLGEYNLMSLPFAYDYHNWGCKEVTYVGEAVQLTDVPFKDKVKLRVYNGKKRADSRYRYESETSPCWELQTMPLAENHGVAFRLIGAKNNSIYRFTAMGEKINSYVYREKAMKTVRLTQANSLNLSAGNSGRPQFTSYENMGWNFVGMPYLVSTYYTGERVDGLTATGYAMDVPHLFYQMDSKTGGYTTAASWNTGTYLKVGDGYLTQTAILDDFEDMSFALPMPVAETQPSAQKRLLLTSEQGQDEVEIYPSEVAQDISYHWGMDGVKWMAMNENLPQLYLYNDDGTRFSWVSAAPVETDLPLGIRVMVPGKHIFTLENPKAYDDYARVWLTDHETGAVTDLKTSDYVVDLEESLAGEDRFTLRFDGSASLKENLTGNQYQVYIRDGILHILGLDGGESIQVYDIAGRHLLSAKATVRVFEMPLKVGVYIIKVNGNVYKVR